MKITTKNLKVILFIYLLLISSLVYNNYLLESAFLILTPLLITSVFTFGKVIKGALEVSNLKVAFMAFAFILISANLFVSAILLVLGFGLHVSFVILCLCFSGGLYIAVHEFCIHKKKLLNDFLSSGFTKEELEVDIK